jgi:hypothetical protein
VYRPRAALTTARGPSARRRRRASTSTPSTSRRALIPLL